MARNIFSSFIRSAVNQVGRDSGRVISNTVYGDKHSIPIRRVGGNGSSNSSGDATSGKVDEAMLDRAVVRQNLNVGTWKMVWYLFLGYIFIFIGPIFLIYNGIKRITRKEITIKRLIYKDLYEPNEMGDEKERFMGNETYVAKEKAPKTEHEMQVDRRVGTIYLVAGIIFLLFYALAIFIAQSEG